MKNYSNFNTATMNVLMKAIIVVTLLLLTVTGVFAQSNKNTLGIRSYLTVTGSGHGASITPALFYRHNRAIVSVGPIVSMKCNKVNGVQASYEYMLVGASKNMSECYFNEKFELFAFSAVQYRPSDCLSKGAIEMEQTSEMKSNPYEHMKVSTAEAYAGFGLKVKIIKGLQWSNSIGMGGYYSPNSPSEIYRQRSNACLILRTGLYYSFR